MITGNASILRLQYRRSWSSPWITDKGTVEIGKWKRGIGNQVGSLELASFELPTILGGGGNAGREEGGALCPLQIGDFIRVVEVVRSVNKAGVISFTLTNPLVVHFTGVLLSRTTTLLGRQKATSQTNPALDLRRVVWTVGGMGALLGMIDLGRFWGCAGALGDLRVIDGIPQFTPDRARNRASDAVGTFQIGWRARSQKWTALDVLDALLNWHLKNAASSSGGMPALSQRFPTWPAFQIGGLTNCLAYEVRDVQAVGQLIDAFVGLAHPRRGCSFVVNPPVPSADQTGPCTIRILSLLESAITVTIPASEGGGSIILPASDLPSSTMDVNQPHRSVVLGEETMPRELQLSGKGRFAIINLRWSRDSGGVETGQLTRGWKSADDTATLSDAPKYLDVYRTFHLRPAWDGRITTGELPSTHSTTGTDDAPDPLYGAGGRNGAMSAAAGTPYPASNVELTDHLPLPSKAKDAGGAVIDLETWLVAPTGSTLDYQSTRLRPQAWAHNRTANTWTRLKVAVAITNGNTITLGNDTSDAVKIRSALSANDIDLVILCAIREAMPFCVSYRPPTPAAGAIPIGASRERSVPWAEYVWIAQDTTLGLTDTGAPVKPAAAVVVRDDTAILQQTLALMRPLGERAATITVSDRINLNTLPEPGSLVTQFTAGDGIYLPLRYVVTSLEGDPSESGYGHTIQCEIPEIDLKAVL
jgi:hypothetical protein